MNPSIEQFQQFLGVGIFVFAALMIWSIIWKGIALWKAARNGHKAWYVILLIVNTVGILEIIYILCCSKKKAAETQQPQV